MTEVVRRKKRSRSSGRVDGEDIKTMLKSVMRRLNAIEHRQKHYRHRPVHSSDYSESDQASNSDDVVSDDLSSDEDELRVTADATYSRTNAGCTANSLPDPVNMTSILGDDEITEKCFSGPILQELVPHYEKVLLGGMKEETRVELIKRYLPPENMTAIVPPKINPEVRMAIKENTLRRDNRLSKVQEQLAAVISALVQFTSDLTKKGGEENLSYIATTNDALRLLCDVFHHESVSRRELLLLNVNKDLKETLKNTAISEFLFGTELETQYRLLINSRSLASESTLASTSKQGNYRSPFTKGVQQMGHKFQRRSPTEQQPQKDEESSSSSNLSSQKQQREKTPILVQRIAPIEPNGHKKIDAIDSSLKSYCRRDFIPRNPCNGPPSVVEKSYPGSREVVREALLQGRVPLVAMDICLASITDSTFKQYSGAYAYGGHFVWAKTLTHIVTVENVLEFLTFHFHRGRYLWSGLGTGFSGQAFVFSKEFLVKDHQKPDTRIFGSTDSVNSFLLALATGQRLQTISLIRVSNISIQSQRILIRISDRIKTSSINRSQPTINLPFFVDEPQILERHQGFESSSDWLFITFKKPKSIYFYYKQMDQRHFRKEWAGHVNL
nr:unnamed protein product [Callosobruchus chinensis]